MSNTNRPTSDGLDRGNPESPRRGVLGWIIRHPKLAAMGALVLLLVGTCQLFDMKAEQAFQHELDAIRASGAPVTLDDLNAVKCDVPDDENIALLIEAPAKAIEAYKVPEDRREQTPVIGNGPQPLCGERMRPEALAAVEACLVELSPHLAEVHEVLQHGHGCRKANWVSPAIALQNTELVKTIRATSRALMLQTWQAAQADDRAAAYESALDSIKLDRALQGEDHLAGDLTRTTVRTMALDAAACAVNHCGLDDAQLIEVGKLLKESDWVGRFRRAMEVERVIALDAIAWSLDGKQAVGDWRPLPVFVRFIPILRPLSNAKGLRVWQLYVDALNAPESEILTGILSAQKEANALPDYCILWKMLTPTIDRAFVLVLRMIGSERAMLAALACERYRLANGEWPESLDVLVPTYLDAVPLDPFDAQPIRYVQVEHGIIAYSVGEDQRDGGGDVTDRDINKPQKRPSDEGFVLLNPELRNREPMPADDAKDEAADGK